MRKVPCSGCVLIREGLGLKVSGGERESSQPNKPKQTTNKTKKAETKMNTETQTTEVTTETSTTEATEGKRRGRKRKISDKQLARATELYKQGWSPAKIANQSWFTGSASALYYHLRGASPVGDVEVEMRSRGRTGPSEAQVAFLLAQHAAGERVSNIREMPQMRRGVEFDAETGELTAKSQRQVKRGAKKFAAQTLSKILKENGCEIKRGRPPVAKPEAEEAAVEAAPEAPEVPEVPEAPALTVVSDEPAEAPAE